MLPPSSHQLEVGPMIGLPVDSNSALLKADKNYNQYEIIVSYSDDDSAKDNTHAAYGLAWEFGPRDEAEPQQWHDLNCDGAIDGQDMLVLLENMLKFGNGGDQYLIGDINGDGSIDFDDTEVLLKKVELPLGK